MRAANRSLVNVLPIRAALLRVFSIENCASIDEWFQKCAGGSPTKNRTAVTLPDILPVGDFPFLFLRELLQGFRLIPNAKKKKREKERGSKAFEETKTQSHPFSKI